MPEDEKQNLDYKPSDADKKVIDRITEEFEAMKRKRDTAYPQFNDLTLKDYVDTGEKRLNAYTPSRESYDPPKRDWQANISTQIIRNKQKAIVSAVVGTPPDFEIKAISTNNEKLNVDRAYILKNLLKDSYLDAFGNPEIDNFFSAWQSVGDGTVFEYSGYLKPKQKKKTLKDYDITTGKVGFSEEEINIEDKCVDILLPITELYLSDYNIFDIQDQPSLAWVKLYDKQSLKKEFEKYPNYKYIKSRSELEENNTDTFYFNNSQRRTDEEMYEVVRYYNKFEDEYIIIINGVLILEAPLLWEINGRKVYPFAKGIFEVFTGKHFAYGKSLPDILQADFDVYNTLLNMMIDKQYKSMVKPLLVGEENQEAFDLEEEVLAGDMRIPVVNVNQVRELDVRGITGDDVNMIEMISKGLDFASVDPNQQGVQGKGVTAREVVIADERAKEVKSLFFKFLTDLWRQKYLLRIANIITNYSQAREIIKDGKKTKVHRKYVIHDTEIDQEVAEEGNKKEEEVKIEKVKGTLIIEFRDIKNEAERNKIDNENKIEAEKLMAEGKNVEFRTLPTTFLNDFEYQIQVISESLYRSGLSKSQALATEKAEVARTLFPEIFMANRDKFFGEIMKAYDDQPEEYLERLEEQGGEEAMQEEMVQEGEGGEPPMLPEAKKSLPNL